MLKEEKLFGTDGIRREILTEPLCPDTLVKIGQAFGFFLKNHFNFQQKPKVIIGKDTRASGYMIELALGSGLISAGCQALFLGPIPTAGVSYLVRGLRVQGGIMISASHNLWIDNGLKFFDSNGFKLDEESQEILENYIKHHPASLLMTHPKDLGKAKRVDDALVQYLVFLKEQYPRSLNLNDVKIVVDCAHGASYRIAPRLFEELGAQVYPLHISPNGYNINLNSGSESPGLLQEKVQQEQADLGFAFDGDSDRLVMVGPNGKIWPGEALIALLALRWASDKRIVLSTMVNTGLSLFLKERGFDVVYSDVGDQKVLQKMREHHITLGAEPSGHIIFLENSLCSDGLLSALKVLEIYQQNRSLFQEVESQLHLLPHVLKNIPVPCKPQLHELPLLQNEIHSTETNLRGFGRVIFRYSGTEPKARILVESPSEDFNHARVSAIEQAFWKDLKHLGKNHQ